jgi:hypothetical protein
VKKVPAAAAAATGTVRDTIKKVCAAGGVCV